MVSLKQKLEVQLQTLNPISSLTISRWSRSVTVAPSKILFIRDNHHRTQEKGQMIGNSSDPTCIRSQNLKKREKTKSHTRDAK